LVRVQQATVGPIRTPTVNSAVSVTLVPASAATPMNTGRWSQKNTSAIRLRRARWARSKSEIPGGNTR
jgi:hypothetical protein